MDTKKSYILAVSGVARCGKNLFASSLIRILNEAGIETKEYSFAKELKKEVNPLTALNLGISAFTEDDKEKAIIRPLLLCWGTDVWRKLDENHWVKKVEDVIKNSTVPHIAVVTDARFENECLWAQRNGFVFHVEKLKDGKVLPPNNKDEEKNDPIVKNLANYRHIWQTFGDDHANLGYYNVRELVNSLFSDKIPAWQKDFPQTKT